MLIIKLIKAVILTTYLFCCLFNHKVQSRYMTVNQNQDQSFGHRANLKAVHSALISSVYHPEKPHSKSARTTQMRLQMEHIETQHHRHRHHHNLITNTSSLETSSSSPPSSSSSSKNSSLFPKSMKRHPSSSASMRLFLLYNRCSGRYVELMGKSIDALAPDTSKYALMSFETQKYGAHLGIRILAKNAGVYLCFNKKGRLITRFNGANVSCLFKEVPERRYIKFTSLYNPDWYIGFNKNGRPIHGRINQHSRTVNPKKEKCYHFIKRYPSEDAWQDSSHESFISSIR